MHQVKEFYTFESLEALEQTVVDQGEELVKLRAQVRYIERDMEVWTSRFDELIQEMQRQQREAIYYLTSGVSLDRPTDLSLMLVAERAKLLTELLDTAQSIVEHWDGGQNSRE